MAVKLLAGVDPFGGTPYNYKTFERSHLSSEAVAVIESRGVTPGTLAPLFELPKVDGGTWRLARALTKPVLLHFGSYT